MGLGRLLGLTSLGTSLYNVNKLAENLNTVSKSCQFILGSIEQRDAKIAMMTNFLGLTTMLGNLNAQLSAWGRGLEALTEGKLHPSLINQ